MTGPTVVIERQEVILAPVLDVPTIVTELREIILTQVPGVGPPGSIEGGFSVNGEPPFDMSGGIEGAGGLAVVAQGVSRFTMPRPGTLAYVLFSAGIAPQGQSLVFDVNKNGTSLWPNPIDRPSISPGQNVSLKVVPTIVNFLAGDYFTVDIDQTGSLGTPGGGITFSIWYF